MHTLFQDLQYAFRQLWRSPGFTIAAVLSLAIGIGINTAIFSNMDAVVLHPLAVPQLDRVVTVAERNARSSFASGYEQVALVKRSKFIPKSLASIKFSNPLIGLPDYSKVYEYLS